MAYDNENSPAGREPRYNNSHSAENRSYNRQQERSNDRNQDPVFSRRVKAGKRRTYFFDVRATRGNDYFLTITESKKRFDDGGYDRHKMFLYKEDFNKFAAALEETIAYVKTELMPDFDFNSFSHENEGEYVAGGQQHNNYAPAETGYNAVPAEEAVYLPANEDFVIAETAPQYVEPLTAEETPVATPDDTEIDGWKA